MTLNLPIQWNVVRAVCRRDLGSQFASPTGYVFVTIFVFLSAFAAFWLPGFFERNINSLDQLNVWFPLLLLILAPAIAMGAWVEERRSGTDALLLTLPAGPASIVLGKHLAVMLIYSAALLVALLGEVGVLLYLGSPDPGLLVANSIGYWLAGIALVSTALAAGSVTRNQTVSFVLAAIACAVIVGLGWLLRLAPGEGVRAIVPTVDFPAHLASFARGVVALDDVVYFLGIAIIAMGVNVLLVDWRRNAGATGSGAIAAYSLIRTAAAIVTLLAVTVTLGRFSASIDMTAERLWSLSDETLWLIDEIPPDRPVLITAFISREAPGRYAQSQQTLTGLLEAMRSASHGRIKLRIVPTEPYTEEAREARRVYGITPAIVSTESGGGATREVYLGVAVTSGVERSVIPLLTPGLPVEYELTRAVRSVSTATRKRIGILDTDANLFGAFDFTTLQPGRDWPIIAELRKQHIVERVGAGTPVPDDIDCLIVAQPSALTDSQIPALIDYIRNGGPTLLMEDPMPQIKPGIASAAPRGADRNPFLEVPELELDPKANLKPLWDLLGAIVPSDRIIWDGYKPHPQLAALPPEMIFVGPGSGTPGAINPDDPVTSGLQEVVLPSPGELRTNPTITLGEPPTIIPLLRTSPVGGHTLYAEAVGMSPFGPQWPLPDRKFYQTNEPEVLAARLFGRPADTDPGEELIDELIDKEEAAAKSEQQRLRVIIVADLDIISPDFFALRRLGVGDLEFDNITFILNSVDLLVGDDSLIELRKRRRAHRTLSRLDDARQARLRESRLAIDAANDAAEEELIEARERIEAKIEAIRARTDLDKTTQRIMIESVQRDEQRKFTAQTQRIEDEKATRIAEAQAASIRAIRAIEFRIRVAAVSLPPIPAFLVGAAVFWRRRRLERQGVVQERLQ